MAKASELLWVLVVGLRDAGGVGKCGLFHRVCRCVVAIFQKQDHE